MGSHERVIRERDAESVSIIALIDAVVKDAFEREASDIHIDPNRAQLCVRMRIDGELCDAYTLPSSLHAELIARIKILSGIRIDEHFIPQDGSFEFRDQERECFIRTSIMPTQYGENAVLRLFIMESGRASLSSLGMSESLQERVQETMDRPGGMILVAGPTGSGKTTTLYALMQLLEAREDVLVSIEDPIERTLPGVRQLSVNEQVGFTFATALRSILRQDPDVIMVGEIRDVETARIAIQAALTGHLVLSTIHAHGAAEVFLRLRDMGIEPYLLSSVVQLVVAQRLLRRICAHCRVVRMVSKEERECFAQDVETDMRLFPITYIGKGCELCSGQGYKGRVGIFESLHASRELEEKVRSFASVGDMGTLVRDSFAREGLRASAAGLVSFDEVVRTCHAYA